MNYLLLFLGILSLNISLFLIRRKEHTSLFFLFSGSLFLGFFIALLDPFLNTWDEQFHALVAKNIANNGLTPMLYPSHSLDFDYSIWTNNEVWLHKQPLFLWQMALSIKLFGANKLAVRLPSIIMHAFTSVFIFYIGKNLINKYVGLIGAILFSVSFYQLELITGKYSTDHNDVAFLFYCTGSFWAWFNFIKTKQKKWLFILGVFSGCAVLIKWLFGLLVYVIWFLINLINDKKNVLSNMYNMFVPSIISAFIFIPWQIYTFSKYPKEAYHEYNYNSLHLYKSIEAHSGSWTFHFDQGINELYGDGFLVPLVLIIGIIITYYKSKTRSMKLFFVLSILFAYTFFSIVATKMLSYTIIVSPFIFISIATLVYGFSYLLQKKVHIIISMVFIVNIVGFSVLNLKKIKHKHSITNNMNKIKERNNIRLLMTSLPNDNYVVFNFNNSPYGNISAMFYSNYECYEHIPSQKEIDKINSQNKNIACLIDENTPNYIKNNPFIFKIIKSD